MEGKMPCIRVLGLGSFINEGTPVHTTSPPEKRFTQSLIHSREHPDTKPLVIGVPLNGIPEFRTPPSSEVL